MAPNSSFDIAIGLLGIFTSIVALIMFMELISEAFTKHKGPRSLITGVQAMLFPIGTYYYCKTNWETYGKRFKSITTLLCIGIVSILISKTV